MIPKASRPKNEVRTIVPILLLLTILIISILGTAISWNLSVRQMENAHVEEVKHNTSELYDELQRQFAILDGYSASFTQEQLNDHNALLEKLNRCVKNTEFALVCFAYPDGTLYRNDNVKVSVSHRFYFQQAMQQENVIEFLENAAIDPADRVGMAVPVILNGQVQGVLLGLYDREGFQPIFERTFSDSRSLTYICDSTGKLILGTAAAETFLTEHDMEIETSNIMDIMEASDFIDGNKSLVEQHMRYGQSGQVKYSYDGAQRLTAYIPLLNDWYIVSVLQESQIYKDVIGFTGIFYVIILLATLAVMFIIFYLFLSERKLTLFEKKRNEEIKYLLEHDSLTDLPTEQLFREQVKERLGNIRPDEYCLIYFDIYKFKLINEMFGYAKGSELIRTLASELKALTRQYDGLCCRISGDNFVLFLPHRQDIIQEFNTKKYRKKRIVPTEIYLHYGIYVIQNTDMPVNQMVDCAQLAQKTVKGNYDNCIAYYDEQIKEKIVKEQEIITSMGKALTDGEFVVYLQPQYNYRTGQACGAETLVRWISPTKGFISPGDFIPVFESNGFIIQLDEYIWEQVCMLQRRWLDEGRKILPLSINVSRADLLSGDIAQKLTDLIEKYQLTPDMLRVEITESAYMDNPKMLIMETVKLAECGFTVEMDDFGSGYSSLNMLKDVPFQILKTDLHFLSDTGDESRKERILAGIVRMAHEMGMTVIAEGVETREQADYLLRLDCEQMQGYYFSKPLPADEFEKLLSQK